MRNEWKHILKIIDLLLMKCVGNMKSVQRNALRMNFVITRQKVRNNIKCPKCGTEMVWMGNVTILIKNTDKYLYKLSKKAFRSKDVELQGVDWYGGDLFCPNYLQCSNYPVIKHKAESKVEE